MRRKYFTVVGKGSFPFVMLSRDECYPANTAEAEKILMSCPTVTSQEYQITLATTKEGAPTGQMWRAHKWPVTLIE